MSAPVLTVETIETPEGYEFIRSDGERFFMVGVGDRGNVVVYKGAHGSPVPPLGLVDLDVNVQNKVSVAREHVLKWKR